jgi:hypothetical protein
MATKTISIEVDAYEPLALDEFINRFRVNERFPASRVSITLLSSSPRLTPPQLSRHTQAMSATLPNASYRWWRHS